MSDLANNANDMPWDAPTPTEGTTAVAASRKNRPDDVESPQPPIRTRLSSDFHWRDLKPRCYGKSLPPLDPAERENLKKSIVSRGFLGTILIDESLQILEGNTRWEICCETDVTPEVEMISGLSEEEKEETVLSCNCDRRNLKDPEVELIVREARLENLFALRQKDPKKWSLQKIAGLFGVSLATVSIWERDRHNSNGGTVSKPDGRRSYSNDLKREAVRLVKDGKLKADVARQLVMHPKAVERAVKEETKRTSGSGASKRVKGEKGSTDSSTQPMQVTDAITANDGVPQIHRQALKHLGLAPQVYAERLETFWANAQQNVDKFPDNVDELLNLSLYGSQLTAAAEMKLRQLLHTSSEADLEEATPGDSCPDADGYEVGSVHLGTVIGVNPDGVYVALSGGGGGVICDSGTNLTWYSQPEEGKVVRVRVRGFDTQRSLVDLQLLGRQSLAHADCASVIGQHVDNRTMPYAELSGRKAGPQEKEGI
jgi:transposase-like protein